MLLLFNCWFYLVICVYIIGNNGFYILCGVWFLGFLKYRIIYIIFLLLYTHSSLYLHYYSTITSITLYHSLYTTLLLLHRRPTTEDELEEFGEFGANIGGERSLPRLIIDTTRKRKGLAIEEKVVMYAEKQRTLNKKK